MKIMLDTNVVLDVLLKREPFFQASYEVMRLSAVDALEGCVSAAAVTDIFYLLRKALRDNQAAKNGIEKLGQIVGFVDALGEDVHVAIASDMSDFEDALVAAIAQRCGVDCSVTRNTRDYRESPVKALTPDELLKHIT